MVKIYAKSKLIGKISEMLEKLNREITRVYCICSRG